MFILMTFLSSFTHPNVVSNAYNFLSSAEQKNDGLHFLLQYVKYLFFALFTH